MTTRNFILRSDYLLRAAALCAIYLMPVITSKGAGFHLDKGDTTFTFDAGYAVKDDGLADDANSYRGGLTLSHQVFRDLSVGLRMRYINTTFEFSYSKWKSYVTYVRGYYYSYPVRRYYEVQVNEKYTHDDLFIEPIANIVIINTTHFKPSIFGGLSHYRYDYKYRSNEYESDSYDGDETEIFYGIALDIHFDDTISFIASYTVYDEDKIGTDKEVDAKLFFALTDNTGAFLSYSEIYDYEYAGAGVTWKF